MKSKHGVHAKKVQKSAGAYFVLISKDSVESLDLRAQDPKCLMVEVADPERHRLIYQVVRLGL